MKTEKWANIVLCLVIFGIIAFGIQKVASAPDFISFLNPEATVNERVRALEHDVVLEQYNIGINQVSKEAKAHFKISNKSESAISNIELSCTYHDRQGIYWGRGTWVVYDKIESGAVGNVMLTDKRYISYRVTPDTIKCSIVDLCIDGNIAANHEKPDH